MKWFALAELHRRLVAVGPQNRWEKFLFYLLVPLSMAYGSVLWLRNRLYDAGLLPIATADIPVVSVGNMAAGGTGKTPVVDWLAKQLARQGIRAAILSRGYGGSFTGKAGIVADGQALKLSAREAGDEPYLLALRNPSVPVVIARKRREGIRLIEKQFHVDLVILDDAFQHRAVARNLDIVLLDASRPFGNGLPLPAGSLREFSGGIKRADIAVMTRANQAGPDVFVGLPAFYATYHLADRAIALNGQAVSLQDLREQKVVAFAGIAHPDSFFRQLESRGISLAEAISLPDHVCFEGEIIEELKRKAAAADCLITTEKDAVKLAVDLFAVPCYQVPLELVITREEEFILLVNQHVKRGVS